MKRLETTIANLDRDSDIPLYSVALKKIPAHYVISVRGIIETPDKEAELWERLAQERKKQKIQFTNPAWNIAVFHDEGFQDRNLDVEIQQAVIGKCRDSDIMKYKKVEEITVATLTFKGRYALLPQANEEIIRWIGDNCYKLNGNHFNIYHISPEMEQLEDEMVTEVCFPVSPI